MKIILNELENISNTLNPEEIDVVVKLCTSGKFDKIVGFGAGRMGYALRAFIMRLCHIGFDAYMIGDTNFPKIDEKTLVLINSSSGNTETMVLYAMQAKKFNGQVVTFTANASGSLNSVSDYLVTYQVNETKQIMKTVYEQFSFILFDHIAECIIQQSKRSRTWISSNHSISE